MRKKEKSPFYFLLTCCLEKKFLYFWVIVHHRDDGSHHSIKINSCRQVGQRDGKRVALFHTHAGRIISHTQTTRNKEM